MLLIYTLIFAVIQAATEFFPVSSSAHLIIFHDLLRFDLLDGLTFDVALHFGTLLALIIYFRREIAKYCRSFISIFSGFSWAHDDQKTVANLVLATIPAALAGFLFEDFIADNLRSLFYIGLALILGGLGLLAAERWGRKKFRFEGLSVPEALGIGLAQVLALIPGISRSGATMTAGLGFGLRRSEAAKFSFLLSIPIIFGAAVKKFFDLNFGLLTAAEIYTLLFAIFVSFVAGYFVIKYFLKFLDKHSLAVFGWYRIGLGIILLLIVFLWR
jgi:undecaprenyl-diphosphatase